MYGFWRILYFPITDNWKWCKVLYYWSNITNFFVSINFFMHSVHLIPHEGLQIARESLVTSIYLKWNDWTLFHVIVTQAHRSKHYIISSSDHTKTNRSVDFSGVFKGVGFCIKKGSMSEEEAEGSIQVEDTSEKENIEPPLKKAKLRDDRKSDRLVKLEARLNDILSCTVCLDLPTKSVFQVGIKLIKCRDEISSCLVQW